MLGCKTFSQIQVFRSHNSMAGTPNWNTDNILAEAQPTLTYLGQHIPRTFKMRFYADVPFRVNMFVSCSRIYVNMSNPITVASAPNCHAMSPVIPPCYALPPTCLTWANTCPGHLMPINRPSETLPPTHSENPDRTQHQKHIIDLSFDPEASSCG